MKQEMEIKTKPNLYILLPQPKTELHIQIAKCRDILKPKIRLRLGIRKIFNLNVGFSCGVGNYGEISSIFVNIFGIGYFDLSSIWDFSICIICDLSLEFRFSCGICKDLVSFMSLFLFLIVSMKFSSIV